MNELAFLMSKEAKYAKNTEGGHTSLLVVLF
jgi:hypothetical protein